MLLTFLQLQDRPTSSPRQNNNIRNWLANYPNVIAPEEQKFVGPDHDIDLLTTRVRKRTLLGRMLQEKGITELAAKSLPSFLRTADGKTEYFDHSRWAIIGEVYLSWITLWMLLLPLWFARLATSPEAQLALITAFTLGAYILILLGTTLHPIARSGTVLSYVPTQLVCFSVELIYCRYLVVLILIVRLSAGFEITRVLDDL